MRAHATFQIAKAELRTVFFTPIAWVMFAVFALVCAVQFTDVYTAVATANETRSLSFLTDTVFSSDYIGLFNSITPYIFFFIPLVTMGMISRDYSTGSDKLFLSSPVRVGEIVLGKFLAAAAYSLALCAIIGIFVVFGAFAIENMDAPAALTGLLGIFLLTCAYASVGIFMSSLTSYQAVSALLTFATLAALTYMKQLWQNIPFVRNLTYWLSLDGRCEGFIKGMICSEDVVYFLAVTAFFLSLTAIRLSSKTRRGRPSREPALYLAAIFSLAAVDAVSQIPSLKVYHDSTETKRLTLTEESQRVMKEVKGKAVLTTYVNVLDDNGVYLALPEYYNRDKEYLEQYYRFKPDLRLKYVYYWTDIHAESVARHYPDMSPAGQADQICDAYGIPFNAVLSPEEIAPEADLSGEEYRIVSKIKARDGKSELLRFFDDSQRKPMEKEITAAFKRLAEGPVNVGFVQGHGERLTDSPADRDWYAFSTAKRFRHSLVNNGFSPSTVDVSEPVPEDVSILVIADPRTAMTETEMANIASYIDSGRNLLVAGEPGHEDFLNPLLERIGARLGGFSADSLVKGEISPDTSMEKMRGLRDYKITMPGACGIEQINADFSFSPAVFSDSTLSHAVAVEMRRDIRGKEQKVFLLGDADCFSTGELMKDRYAVSSANFDFIYEVFRYLSDGKYPIDTSRHRGSDNEIRISSQWNTAVKWGFIGLLPFLLIASGSVIVLRRRSK